MNVNRSKSGTFLFIGLYALFSFTRATAAADLKAMKVAFVLTEGANVIDMTGPWEVFQDTMWDDASGHHMPFELFTVGASTEPVAMTGGLRATPTYTFANAPQPDIVVVGAQRGAPALADWLRARAKDSKIVMSVCTGAFKLGAAGLLDGKQATTHHDFWDDFANQFPKVQLQRGSRFVQSDNVIYTAGGLTSGIDLALHVVEKFFGKEVAERTAAYMEYHPGSR